MKTTIQFNNVSFVISASLVASGVPFQIIKTVTHNITNTVLGWFAIMLNVLFLYFDSIANHMAYKKELSESDLQYAFYCFVSDSVSGKSSFEDFCSEFGYDSDSRTAEKIWRSCGRSFDKLKELLPPDIDIYDLLNYLIDLENAE